MCLRWVRLHYNFTEQNNNYNNYYYDENNLNYSSRVNDEEIFDNNNYNYLNYNARFPNKDVSGFFEWTYNGIVFPQTSPVSSQPLSFTNIAGTTNVSDAGNPNHDYYDPDLTVNDRGINGGPYSVLNYNSANPNNSKAFIFDLDMPADLFPGQNVEIKAQGYHKN